MKTLATLLAALSIGAFAIGCNGAGEADATGEAEETANQALETAREAKEDALDAEQTAEQALEAAQDEPAGGETP